MTDLSPEAVEALVPKLINNTATRKEQEQAAGHIVDLIAEREALVAAAYDDAIAAIEPHAKADVKTGGVLYEAQKAIKMRTHINARAALDTLLAAARKKGMEDARAQLAETHPTVPEAARALLGAIEYGGEVYDRIDTAVRGEIEDEQGYVDAFCAALHALSENSQ